MLEIAVYFNRRPKSKNFNPNTPIFDDLYPGVYNYYMIRYNSTVFSINKLKLNQIKNSGQDD